MLSAGPELRRLKRSEYDTLVSSGAFVGERVELLDGLVIHMGPHGPEHDGTLDVLQDLFHAALAGRARLRVQAAFVAGDDGEPEPDLALVPLGDYRDAHPAQAFLVVEVAHSSLAHDRRKAATYARAGVPEYWIVDLAHQTVEVYRRPVAGRYEQTTTHRRPDVLHAEAFADIDIPLDRVLRG